MGKYVLEFFLAYLKRKAIAQKFRISEVEENSILTQPLFKYKDTEA